MSDLGRCFSCGKKIKLSAHIHTVDTRDDQRVEVGPECFKKIEAAGVAGYQPTKGGPRLWTEEYSFHNSLNGYICEYTDQQSDSKAPSLLEVALWARAYMKKYLREVP